MYIPSHQNEIYNFIFYTPKYSISFGPNDLEYLVLTLYESVNKSKLVEVSIIYHSVDLIKNIGANITVQLCSFI